jgi:phosphoglycolate phosphatase
MTKHNIHPSDYNVHIFDLDGTLTNTAPTWLGIFRDGLTDFGISGATDETIAANTHNWAAVTNLGVRPEDVDQFRVTAYERANQRLPEAPLHDGALPMLTSLLEAGKQTGVFTTMDRPILEPVIAHRPELFSLIGAVVAGTDVPHRKPHPAGLYSTFGKLGVELDTRDTAIYWGDKDTDIETARNAGIASGLFYPAEHAGLYSEDTIAAMRPTHRIAHWGEVSSGLIAPFRN